MHARSRFSLIGLLALLFTAATVQAQAPAGATGVCKDGSYSYSATPRGACARHGGVQQWLAPTSAPTPKGAPTRPTAPPTPASGTQVWLNTPTMVYHCPGARWYGTTKKGLYMTEAEAKTKGARPAYGKTCT